MRRHSGWCILHLLPHTSSFRFSIHPAINPPSYLGPDELSATVGLERTITLLCLARCLLSRTTYDCLASCGDKTNESHLQGKISISSVSSQFVCRCPSIFPSVLVSSLMPCPVTFSITHHLRTMSRQSTKISYEDSQYESVPNSSEDSLHIPRSRSRRWHLLPFLAGVIAASSVALAILVVHSAIRTPSTITKHETHTDQSQKTAADIDAEVERLGWNYCGESSAEAIERGCSMEPLFYGWFPSQCVYQELTDKFPVFEDRTYYSDWNLTERVLPEDLWTGKFATVYTPK